MSFVDTYSEVMASVAEISTQEQLESFIRKIISAYELKHAIYYFPGKPGNDAIAPVSFISYEKDWIERFRRRLSQHRSRRFRRLCQPSPGRLERLRCGRRG
jgi:hypothetical protein